jgi:hypothetical protein
MTKAEQARVDFLVPVARVRSLLLPGFREENCSLIHTQVPNNSEPTFRTSRQWVNAYSTMFVANA